MLALAIQLAALVTGAARAADHAEAPILSGSDIPGGAGTFVDIGPAYTDGGLTVFEGSDSAGNAGFAVIKLFDPVGLKWQPTPKPLGKATLSTPSFAFLADDGVPSIFGVPDVAAWSTPQLLVKVGSELPGGWTVSELGDFALGGKKLVVIAKKIGGEGIFGLDFEGGVPIFVAGTGTPTPDLGDISGLKGVATDGRKILFHAVAEAGEGIYLTGDFSAEQLDPVATTGEIIPKLENKFFKFGQLDWNGKKATFQGAGPGGEQGIYFDDGAPELGVLADTTFPWLGDPDLLFTSIEGFSVAGDETAFLATASDGGRSAYLDSAGKVKRLLSDGDLLVGGHKLTSFKFTHKALGSLVATGSLETGQSALVVADTAAAVPALRSLGLRLLLFVALLAVALTWRAQRASA